MAEIIQQVGMAGCLAAETIQQVDMAGLSSG